MFGYLTLFVFPACLLAAAAYDVSSFRIPNFLPAIVAATYLPAAFLAGLPIDEIAIGLGLGVGFLVLGMVLFALRWFGGGDAKLLAAAAPWMGFGHVLDYVVTVALVGGVVVLGLLFFRSIPLPAFAAQRDWVMRLHSTKEGVPYGVALAVAGLILYPQTALYLHMAG